MIPPSGVESSCFADLAGPGSRNLVAATPSGIDVFAIRPRTNAAGEETGFARLDHVTTLQLAERPTSVRRVVLQGGAARSVSGLSTCDVLAVSFEASRVAILGLDPTSLRLVTLSLISFEEVVSRSACVNVPAFAPTGNASPAQAVGRVIVDPAHRCIAQIVTSESVAIMPLRQASAPSLPPTGAAAAAAVAAAAGTPGHSLGGSADSVLATASAIHGQPFIASLADVGPAGLAGVVRDAGFLPGYVKPTLAVLVEVTPTCAARLGYVRHSCVLAAFAVRDPSEARPLRTGAFGEASKAARKALSARSAGQSGPAAAAGAGEADPQAAAGGGAAGAGPTDPPQSSRLAATSGAHRGHSGAGHQDADAGQAGRAADDGGVGEDDEDEEEEEEDAGAGGRTQLAWTADALPHDSFAVIPVASPLGGVVVLSPSAIVYATQGRALGCPLNGFASQSLNPATVRIAQPLGQAVPTLAAAMEARAGRAAEVAQPTDRPPRRASLEGCRWAWLRPNRMLLVPRAGQAIVLTLIPSAGGTEVAALDATLAGPTPTPTSSLASMGGAWLFMGSRTGDSVLLSYSLAGDGDGGAAGGEGRAGAAEGSLAKRPRPADAKPQAPLSLVRHARLPSAAPIVDACLIHESTKLAVQDKRPDMVLDLELLACAGEGRTGALLSIKRGLRLKPRSNPLNLSGYVGVFSVAFAPGTAGTALDDAGRPFDRFMLISREGATRALASSEHLKEVLPPASPFVADRQTLFAAGIFGGAAAVQVTDVGARVITPDLERLDLVIPGSAGHSGTTADGGKVAVVDLEVDSEDATPPVVEGASAVGSWLALRLSDGSVTLAEVWAADEDDAAAGDEGGESRAPQAADQGSSGSSGSSSSSGSSGSSRESSGAGETAAADAGRAGDAQDEAEAEEGAEDAEEAEDAGVRVGQLMVAAGARIAARGDVITAVCVFVDSTGHLARAAARDARRRRRAAQAELAEANPTLLATPGMDVAVVPSCAAAVPVAQPDPWLPRSGQRQELAPIAGGEVDGAGSVEPTQLRTPGLAQPSTGSGADDALEAIFAGGRTAWTAKGEASPGIGSEDPSGSGGASAGAGAGHAQEEEEAEEEEALPGFEDDPAEEEEAIPGFEDDDDDAVADDGGVPGLEDDDDPKEDGGAAGGSDAAAAAADPEQDPVASDVSGVGAASGSRKRPRSDGEDGDAPGAEEAAGAPGDDGAGEGHAPQLAVPAADSGNQDTLGSGGGNAKKGEEEEADDDNSDGDDDDDEEEEVSTEAGGEFLVVCRQSGRIQVLSLPNCNVVFDCLDAGASPEVIANDDAAMARRALGVREAQAAVPAGGLLPGDEHMRAADVAMAVIAGRPCLVLAMATGDVSVYQLASADGAPTGGAAAPPPGATASGRTPPLDPRRATALRWVRVDHSVVTRPPSTLAAAAASAAAEAAAAATAAAAAGTPSSSEAAAAAVEAPQAEGLATEGDGAATGAEATPHATAGHPALHQLDPQCARFSRAPSIVCVPDLSGWGAAVAVLSSQPVWVVARRGRPHVVPLVVPDAPGRPPRPGAPSHSAAAASAAGTPLAKAAAAAAEPLGVTSASAGMASLAPFAVASLCPLHVPSGQRSVVALLPHRGLLAISDVTSPDPNTWIAGEALITRQGLGATPRAVVYCRAVSAVPRVVRAPPTGRPGAPPAAPAPLPPGSSKPLIDPVLAVVLEFRTPRPAHVEAAEEAARMRFKGQESEQVDLGPHRDLCSPPDEYAPPVDTVRHVLRVYERRTGVVVKELSLDPSERVLCMSEMALPGDTRARRDSVLVLGTGFVFPRGEDELAQSRMVMLRLGRDLGVEGIPNGSVKPIDMKPRLFRTRGVTAVAPLITPTGNFAVVSTGVRLLVFHWTAGDFEERAFYDLRFWTTSLSVAGPVIAVGDVSQSVRLLQWREQPPNIESMASDGRQLPVLSTAAITGAGRSGIVASTVDGDMVVFEMMSKPTDRLAACAGLRHTAPVPALVRIKLHMTDDATGAALPPATKAPPRFGLICCNTDGGVSVLAATDPKSQVAAHAVAAVAASALPSGAGLDPLRAGAARLARRPGGALADLASGAASRHVLHFGGDFGRLVCAGDRRLLRDAALAAGQEAQGCLAAAGALERAAAVL
ncbi:hypothetical protein FNF31_03503 [Cafeteria roenbergensis]|nr:hypothetical protein FNF31_03503 [Cafeteria roenbergensis]